MGAALIALCLVAARPHAAYGQGFSAGPWFTRTAFTPAYVIPTNPLLTDRPPDSQIRWLPSTTFEIGRQTDGSRQWHQSYGLPAYGFGISVASLGNGNISRPMDAYTFFSWPFARPTDRVHITTDFGMGLSWNWKESTPHASVPRNMLTSAMNVRVDWGFYLRYLATRQMSLYAGVDYTHRSNGGTRQPDEGINVIGPSFALRYNFTPERHEVPVKHATAFQPAWEVTVGGSGGFKNVVDRSNPAVRENFGVAGMTTSLQRHFYRYGKIAAGTDLTYDGATGAVVDSLIGVQSRLAPHDRLALGVYGGYEHVIGRFGALVHAGYQVAHPSDDSIHSRWYGRYGWRYHFNDHFWGIFAVRAIEGRKADFIEFGVGYRKSWR